MLKKVLNLLIIVCMLLAFIPFGNFAQAKPRAESEDNKKKPVELIDQRTENSKTFDNLDGTISTEITQSPQHYVTEDGWSEINTSIEEKNGKLQALENNFTTIFDETLTEQSQGVKIEEEDYNFNLQLKEVVNEKVEQIQPSVGEVNGNQITYPEVFEDISATYTVGENYVKEDIILNEKPESGLPERFTYQLALNGLSYKLIDNTIYLFDEASNENKYLIEAPYMYDSYSPEEFSTSEGIISIPEEAKSYDLKLQVRELNGILYVDLIPNYSWLNDEKRQFPIVIDPMIVRLQGTTQMKDTTLRSNANTTTGGNDLELGVGVANDGNIVRSLLKFDTSVIPNATEIISADLNMYFTSTNNSTSMQVSAHPVTKSWEEDEASWIYSEKTPYTNWTKEGGDFSSAITTSSNLSAAPTSITNGLTKLSLPLDQVQTWVSNPNKNMGILLKSSNEAIKVYKKFASSESTQGIEYKPKLVLTYKTPSRLGLESYWDYANHPLINGSQYVNLGTLNNIVQYHDLSILNNADFNFDFIRTYNSKEYEKSAFGYGWTFSGNEKIYVETGKNKTNIEYK